ncbi:GNAT family N-acetyltransferase [Alicyclobacillus fodiniaquatilis]|uniref:GNAT family N-acetyltransferase n=1 Tax=Alicyclobacillus fodiniaquatilis TaxID=1661150 RepID=A0ABW4JF68_9BACL
MHCERFEDGREFLKVAEDFLDLHDPATNLILSNAYRLQETPPSFDQPFYLALVQQQGAILLAAVMGYRLPLCVYAADDVPEEAFALVSADILDWQSDVRSPQFSMGFLDEYRGAIDKLVAPERVAHAFADVWRNQTGILHNPGMHMRLYELRNVHQPDSIHGHMRLANADEEELVARWHMEMAQEAMDSPMSETEARLGAQSKIAAGRVFLWEADGEAVSMACKTRPTKRGIVLNGVYTPPQYRKRGYATACVAAVSARMLDEGYEFCSLFTDLTNPTSNRIYMNIGYHPVRDYREYPLA